MNTFSNLLYKSLNGAPLDFWENGIYPATTSTWRGAILYRITDIHFWNGYQMDFGNGTRLYVGVTKYNDTYVGNILYSINANRGMGESIRCVALRNGEDTLFLGSRPNLVIQAQHR